MGEDGMIIGSGFISSNWRIYFFSKYFGLSIFIPLILKILKIPLYLHML